MIDEPDLMDKIRYHCVITDNGNLVPRKNLEQQLNLAFPGWSVKKEEPHISWVDYQLPGYDDRVINAAFCRSETQLIFWSDRDVAPVVDAFRKSSGYSLVRV